jgi:hypothetical protein
MLTKLTQNIQNFVKLLNNRPSINHYVIQNLEAKNFLLVASSKRYLASSASQTSLAVGLLW